MLLTDLSEHGPESFVDVGMFLGGLTTGIFLVLKVGKGVMQMVQTQLEELKMEERKRLREAEEPDPPVDP